MKKILFYFSIIGFFWFFLAIIITSLFLGGINSFGWILLLFDGLSLYALHKYSRGNLIKGIFLKGFYLFLSLTLFLRGVGVLYFGVSAMHPWIWSVELLVSIFLVLAALFAFLMAFGLYRYVIDSLKASA